MLSRRRRYRAHVAWASVAIHLAAGLGVLLVAPGTDAEPDVAARGAWIAAHATLWRANWLVWMLAAASLLAFCLVWSARLAELGASRRALAAGCAVVAAGVLFDLTSETMLIVWAPRPGLSADEFASLARWYRWLGPGAANGLYCVGGIVLTAEAWRIGWLRGPLGIMGWVMWGVGVLLTVAAIIDSRPLLVASAAGVIALYTVWVGCVGWKLWGTADERRAAA